jgi:hypothetical protein
MAAHPDHCLPEPKFHAIPDELHLKMLVRQGRLEAEKAKAREIKLQQLEAPAAAVVVKPPLKTVKLQPIAASRRRMSL